MWTVMNTLGNTGGCTGSRHITGEVCVDRSTVGEHVVYTKAGLCFSVLMRAFWLFCFVCQWWEEPCFTYTSSLECGLNQWNSLRLPSFWSLVETYIYAGEVQIIQTETYYAFLSPFKCFKVPFLLLLHHKHLVKLQLYI